MTYGQVDLTESGEPDFGAIADKIEKNKVKAALIQRSRGYDWRDSLTVDTIGEIIKTIKAADKDVICIVDKLLRRVCRGRKNRRTSEPSLIVGSLIKNAGGSLALSGGYIAGRADLVEKVSYRLTAPGLGKHVGASLGMNRNMYQGLFMAPHIVAQSLKTASLCAWMMKKLGFEVCPDVGVKRSDIIQAVKFGSAEKVIKFCQADPEGFADRQLRHAGAVGYARVRGSGHNGGPGLSWQGRFVRVVGGTLRYASHTLRRCRGGIV